MVLAQNDDPAKVAKAHAAHRESFDAKLIIHLSAVVQRNRRSLRSVRTGHDCPVCGGFHAQPNAECAAEFAARSWMDCPACEGTGWDTTGMEVFCRTCCGSKLVEAGPIRSAVAA
ncbi:hypothetical protein ACFQZC_14900 [Streptacidiphilus monticola]